MKKPYVAIVDDDSAFANYLRTFLSLRGYETRSYTRGDELLASVKQGDPPDIVLLDVMMPGMNGLETLRALKAAKPDMQAIMLSGREHASTIVEAVRLGAADYVVKPDDPEGLGEIALDAAIKSAIEKTRLVSEISELRRQLSDDQDRAFLFWGDSPDMKSIASVIEQVSDSDVTVLIRGESGVGKELVSRAIHQRSTRRNRPFVKVNCAALPAELLESELFGHERGAFTGAVARKKGLFELADGGTIFLDEIGDMGLSAQAKVLRVLQSGEFNRVGAETTLKADVRVVAATNRDLQAGVAKGQFREDLFFRLNVVPLRAPPLRDRAEDVPLLSQAFVVQICRENGMKEKPVSPEVLALLSAYPWPGNVRELRNVIERLCILSDETIGPGDLPEEIIAEANRRQRPASTSAAASLATVELPPEARSLPLREFRDLMERQYIRVKLEETGWNISRTAIVLGIERTNLHKKMRSLGLSRDDRAEGGGRDGDDDPHDDGAPDQA